MRWSVLIVCLLVLGACGDDPEPPAGPSTIEKADAYAKELSGGQTEGCSTAKPGPESERNPGCIYGVAFAGCRDALEGSRDAIEEAVAIRDEFPKEPRLWKVYDKGRQGLREPLEISPDCDARRESVLKVLGPSLQDLPKV